MNTGNGSGVFTITDTGILIHPARIPSDSIVIETSFSPLGKSFAKRSTFISDGEVPFVGEISIQSSSEMLAFQAISSLSLFRGAAIQRGGASFDQSSKSILERLFAVRAPAFGKRDKERSFIAFV